MGRTSGLVRELRGALTAYWREGDTSQRWLFAVGTMLVIVGLVHLVPAVLTDRAWQGPISFRKPFLFGVSFGLTSITVAWLTSYLRTGPRARRTVAWLLGGGSVVEVSAVSLQAFRGVPSHFNLTSSFDASVFVIMGVAVTAIALSILLVTWWSFTRLEAPGPMVLGVRTGLLVLLVSQALGGQMVTHGIEQTLADTGREPNVFGAAGQLKVPHAVTVHAAQVLPGIAWLLGFGAWGIARQRRVVVVAAVGYVGLVLAAGLQTFTGRSPMDLMPVSGVLLVAGVALLGGAGLVTLLALASRNATAGTGAPDQAAPAVPPREGRP
ncbi:hypothetical protein [Egibacter rhizosphaerae]|uniref:hypothetical protein n=1 Tax=Egibacter rhizosphaerae TaxID=1670831 RepID=UPI0013F16412|nr:hypothetical protein [Egibacter rhizosphaerae]